MNFDLNLIEEKIIRFLIELVVTLLKGSSSSELTKDSIIL